MCFMADFFVARYKSQNRRQPLNNRCVLGSDIPLFPEGVEQKVVLYQTPSSLPFFGRFVRE